MNLTKKRKLTALITLSALLVAIVATACILTIPNLYKDKDVATTSTADYTINKASYSSSNAYIAMTKPNEGDLRILYPKTMYMDKSESLTDTGYYVAYDAWASCTNLFGSAYDTRMIVFDNVIGYYPGTDSCYVTSDADAYRMHSTFDNYGYTFESLGATDGSSPSVGTGVGTWGGTRNTNLILVAKQVNTVAKLYLTGTIKSEYKNQDIIGSTTAGNPIELKYICETGKTLSVLQYNSGGWKDAGSGTMSSFYASASGDFHLISGLSGVQYTEGITVNIYIYDKSTLKSKATAFRTEMENNKTALQALGAYDRAESFISNIENNIIKAREVTQTQINTAASQIDSYTWQITQPTVYNNGNKTYDGNAVANTTFYSSFNSTYHELKITNSSGTQVSEARSADTYNAQVTIKSGVFSGTRGWSWINSSGTVVGTGYINCATNYTISAKQFTASAANLSYVFKNDNYTIDLRSSGITYTNFVENNGSTVNTKTVELSLDNSNWSSTVALGANGADVKDNTVYFRVSAPNHQTATGHFTVTINKANISIPVVEFDQYYGVTPLTSGEILEKMVSINMPNILNATNITETKALLAQIITKFVIGTANAPIEYDGINYVNAGTYSIDFIRNEEWNDRIGEITFTGNTNRGSYIIKKREVAVTWTQQTNLWYDGLGGKRPTPTIQSVDDIGDGFVPASDLELGAVEVFASEGGPALVNGEAIDAGTYNVSVSLNNPNYIVDQASLNGGSFTIKPRTIKVVLEDRERTYAQQYTAAEVWKNYIEQLFPNNVEVDGKKVFELTLGSNVTDGKDAIIAGDEVKTIFTILLDENVQYTADGKYFMVNESGYDLSLSLLNSNYEFSADSKGAKFVVKPALIDISLQEIPSKIYNGAEQELLMPNNDSVIPLRGYEATDRSELVIEYRANETDPYSTTPVTRKDIGVTNVFYRVTAPNHIVNEGHFTAEITETRIYVDVTGQKSTFTYGDAFPTSADLEEILGINYYWSTDSAINDTLKFDVTDKLQFRLLDGSGGEGTLTADKAIVGKYTVSHTFINGESRDNYIIEYVREGEVHKNTNAFTISQKLLYVDWKQSGEGWKEDGLTFIYNAANPIVRPIAPATWSGEVNVVDGDTINLAEITLGGSVVGSYDAHTSLSRPENQNNYVIANADETFTIVQREIRIYAKDQTASYGNAKTIPLGTALVSPNTAGALWAYADGSLEFARDHYASYKLDSEAHTAPDGQYRDVNTYPITVGPIDAATGEIVNNYDVKVVYDGAPSGMGGMFTITPANISFSGREFNIDISKESNELGYITISQIRDRISTAIGTPTSEFNIAMSDLISSTEDKTFGDLTESDLVETQTRTIDDTSVGSYYILIRITHNRGNYNTFDAKISANFWTDWVSIIISNQIQAEYGSEVYDSAKIFELLEFESITGIVDEHGNNKGLEVALRELKGYVEFFVGSGNTTEPMTGKNEYGTFSIFMNVVDDSKYQHYRFKAYGNASDTSNIGAYKVVERTIGVDWGVMDEEYGEHSDGTNGNVSNSHSYTLTNVLDEDINNVRVDITYFSKDANGNLTPVNGHTINVGTYVARVTGVSHPNYKLPDPEVDGYIEVEYKITPQKISLIISDREITYGAEDATRDGINAFLNRSASGIQLFTVTNGGFAYDETFADVFGFKIGAYTLASNLNYLSANEGDPNLIYTIELDEYGNANYTIEAVTNGYLTVNKANLTFDRAMIQTKRYTGEPINVEPNILYYTLQGDGNAAFASQVVPSFKIFGDATSQYDRNMTLTNASTYQIGIRIEAPNHNAYETTSAVSFEIQKTHVEIYMDPTTKTYGDTLADLLAKDGVQSTGNDVADFSNWLIRHCNITFKTYTLVDGVKDYYDVVGVENDLEFKVIQRGSGNGDALQVGYNDVGLYRVYHIVDNHDLSNYEVDYYYDPSLSNDAIYKCNYAAYEITKRETTVIWNANGAVAGSDGKKFEYTGANVGLTASIELADGTTINGGIDFESRGSLDSKDRVSAINVGKWTAKLVDGGGFTFVAYTNNYEFLNQTYDFEIVPKQVNVTISNMNAVYGTTISKVGATLDSAQYTSSDVEMTGNPIELYIGDVTTDREYYGVGEYHVYGRSTSGNYAVTFKGKDSDNDYAILTITEAGDPTITLSRHDTTYNGNPYEVDLKQILKTSTVGSGEAVYSFAGDMTIDEATILYKQEDGTFSEQLPTIVGVSTSGTTVEYKIQIANHSSTQVYSATIVVNKANLVINISRGASSVYGDALLTSNELYAQANIVMDESASTITGFDIKDYITFSVVADGDITVKDYSITYAFIDPTYGNYFNVTLNGSSNAYAVTPKELTVKWNSVDFVYDGEEHEMVATLEGVINGDVVSALYSGNTGVNAGNYTAQATSVDNGNYILGESASFNWSIAPKAITVEWTAGDFTYDGGEHLVAAPSVAGGLIGDDTCAVSVSGAQTSAGTHTAVAKALNTNYTISNSTYEFVIKQAVVTIVWDETALTYNGNAQAPKAVITGGLVGQDECQVVVSGAQKNAGENYSATASLNNSNYKIETNATNTFAIAPKAITFTWSNTQFTYTSEQQMPNAVAVGAVADDEVEFVIEIVEGNDKGVDVGNYTAVVKGVKANSNYVVDDKSQTSMSTEYTIAKGTNTFNTVPEPTVTVDKLPLDDSYKLEAKWGEVVVKYYTDEACTQEVEDLASAGEGTYWVKATVAGTANYDEISQVFKVELQGGLNVAIIIAGAVLSVVLLIGAFIIVKVTNKKKQQGGAI